MGHAVTLVLTHPFDPTADYVISELNRRGEPVFRCDPGEFPQRLRVAARLDHAGLGWLGSLCLPEREVDLAEIGCVYYRRPTIFDMPTGMGEQVRRWAIAEARMGVGGVLSALPRWLNHPADIGAAEYKPVQLAHARACGLTVPATIVTNDPVEAAKFVADVGQTICKPFTPATVTDGDTHRAVFTTPVVAGDIDESIRLTAHLLQARVAVMALMGRLRLRFGALDFVVTDAGQWIFLEINPNGQWAFIEDATGQPIAAAIADALTKETW